MKFGHLEGTVRFRRVMFGDIWGTGRYSTVQYFFKKYFIQLFIIIVILVVVFVQL